MDLFSYLLGKKSGGVSPTPTGIDWTEIGYSGTPDIITNGYNYAKYILDNYVETTDWQGKFEGDNQLVYAPLIDTSNVTNMWSAFSNCTHLQVIPEYDTSNVTTMRAMFQVCLSLDNPILNFDTSNVTSMMYMFRNCNSLQTLNLSHFNTSKVTTMEQMFRDDLYLTEVNLSSFTSEVLTSTTDMFKGCSRLTKIDLRNFTFNSTTTSTTMFGSSSTTDVPNNCLIIVKDDTEKTALHGRVSRLTNIMTVAEYEASQS